MDNIEYYFEFVDNLLFLGTTLLTAYCYYYLAAKFMKSVKRVWLTGIVYFLLMTVTYYMPFVIGNFTAYALGTFAGFLVMVWLERKNVEQKIFLAVTFFSLRWLSLAMERCIDLIMYQYASEIIAQNDSLKLQWQLFTIQAVLDLLLSFGIMFCAVWLIQKAYVYKSQGMTKRELAILLVSSVSGVLGYEVLQYYNYVYERDTGKSILDIYGVYNWLCFFQYLFSFVTILTIIVIFQNMKSRQEEEKRNEVLSGQIEDMKGHIGQVERLYRNIYSLKHDMGNHVMVLENLYGKKDYEEAGKYIAQLKSRLEEGIPGIKSGNAVTDVILTERQQEAGEKGIEFVCDFHYPEGTSINSFDVSVILNNAVANAIEGTSGCGHPYVHITSYRTRNAYMIEIKNSYPGGLVINGESNIPETSKQDKTRHGFGLSNIRKVARKYHGDIDIRHEGEEFILNIMLMAQ